MFPPNSFEFKVTINDPTQTSTKVSANCGSPTLGSFVLAEP